MICTSLTCLRRTSHQWCFFYFYFQFYRAKTTRQWLWTPRLIKIKGMGFSQFLVKIYEPSLCPMTSYSEVFWGSTGLNIRCFDSIFPIERWPKSGGKSSGSTEFCNNFEMSRQELTILQDVLCTEMLSHIVSSSIWLDGEPLNSSVDRFQQRNLSCRSNRIRGEGSQKKTFFWVNDMDDGKSLVFGSL